MFLGTDVCHWMFKQSQRGSRSGRFPFKEEFILGWQDCQLAVTDEFLCIVAGCVLGIDVCHWMFKTKSTWFKINKTPL